jgi:hypothetical protein
MCTRRKGLLALLGSVLIAAASGSATAAPVSIPNGDFSDAGNFGTIGGGVIGGSGTDVPIGAGPWTGSYAGVLGLLAPPTLTVAAGAATVNGLAAANVLGILDNGGYFSQTLATTFVTQERYTLTADIDTGASLDLGALGNANVGIALRSGASTLASTATAPAQLVGLQPLGGTSYRLSLIFDSNDTTSGAIDVQLFALPQGLIGATLRTDVSFANVTLDATAINPVSGTIVATGGTPQSAMVGTAFVEPLEVRVTDAAGDPVPGVTVTFAAPASGASATLSSDTVTTDIDGSASVIATANTVAGAYAVTASIGGVDTPASFSLTNLAGPAATTSAAAGTPQTTAINTSFPLPLTVFVADAFGNAAAGVDVAFAVPGIGASATLSASDVVTDANGLAQVDATANAQVGSYQVSASVAGVAAPALFDLSNVVDKGTTVGGGSGDGQRAGLGDRFRCALSVIVTNVEGAPQEGYAVDFVAPDSGPSSILFDGVVSGTSLRVLSDADGQAIVTATANDIAGDYVVTAALVGSSAPVVEFALSNVGSLIFSNGFDRPCAYPLPWPP